MAKHKYFYYLSVILMLTTYLPVVYENLPHIVGYHYYWTGLWFISLVFLKPNVFQDKLLILVIVYGLIYVLFLFNTLWIDVDDWNKQLIMRETYQIIVGLSILAYYRASKNFMGLAKLIKITMVFILITAIMSIVASIIEPEYARLITGSSMFQTPDQIQYVEKISKYGGGDYGFAAAIICLFPILIYYYKFNTELLKVKTKYIVIFMIILFFALIRMQIFANILLATFLLIFCFLGRKGQFQTRALVVFMFVVILIIPQKIYGDLCFELSTWFAEGSHLRYKFNDMARYLIYGTEYSGIGSRASRYSMLADSFFSSPFLGHYFSDQSYKDLLAGGHLYWMNKLTVFGLIGFIPFIFILYSIVRKTLHFFNKEYSFYYLMSVFSIGVLGLMKALSRNQLWYMLILILPGLYYLPLLKNRKTVSNTQHTKELKNGKLLYKKF